MVNKIVDKEAEMVAMRKQFLNDNWEKPDEDNSEFRRRDSDDKVPFAEGIGDQQKEKRLKTKWPSYFLGFGIFLMVWFRVLILGFCVMTWFNGMVEFLVILVNGQMVGFGKLWPN